MSIVYLPQIGGLDAVSTVTLAAVGSSPNANGASISSDQVLTLQPVDATHPGILTTGAQTIAGAKTFSSTIVGSVSGSAATATTATNATNVATTSTSTNASFFPLFVASSSNSNQAASLDTTFTYNPSTDNLTATTFTGTATKTAQITNWTACTVTTTWVSNATYTAFSRRVGDSKDYQVTITLTGAPTAATLFVNLPSGDVIDTAKMANTAANRGNIIPFSGCCLRDASVNNYEGGIAYNDTGSVQPIFFDVAGGSFTIPSLVNATAPFTFANTDVITMFFTLPIVGLSA